MIGCIIVIVTSLIHCLLPLINPCWHGPPLVLPKMEELDILALSTNAAIIAVTETWLDNTICDNEVCIPGYSIQRKDRNPEGGGVCILIKMILNFWL